MTMARLLYACLLTALGFTALVDAQVSRGTISGRVSDPNGAAIPGVRITATESATGSAYTTDASSEGEYTIPFLAPGTYRVAAVCTGFKIYQKDGVVVGANEHVGIDIPLEIGQESQTVTVEASSSLLETVNASSGETLNSEDVQHMPVDGNTPLVLSQLTAGVVFANNPQFFHPYDNSGPSGMAIGGAAAKANELLLDGAPDAQGDSTIAYNPPLDAVQQVKVETFQADAAYGHTAGGTVNQVLKSGTNQYHGTLYEYGQWSALNDTPWFTKLAGQEKPVSRFNQYGGSYGAPIVIPHVYDGHNRLFLFFAFEGIQDNAPTPSITTTPTDAEKKGDLSALLGVGSNYTIYDPHSGVQSGDNVVRTAISYDGQANVIPPSEQNPVGMKLASYFGEPNLPGLPNGENNYYYPGNSADSFDSELGRIDVNITSRNKLYYDFRHNNRYHTSGNIFNNVATGSILISPNWGSTVDDVHVFTPQMVWENRINWTRAITSRPLATSVPLSQLGFPDELQSAISHPAFPSTSVPGYVGFGYSKGQYQPFDSWQIFSMLSYNRGKHSFEFGADLRLLKEGNFNFGNPAGSYSFGLSGGLGWTNGPDNNSAAAPIGQELAGMEMGLPTTGSIDYNLNTTTSAEYYALFLHDNYRITPRLTLNLGLRYEHDQPSVESTNKAVNGFDATALSPISDAAEAAYAQDPDPEASFPSTLQGGLTFATSSNRSFYQTNNANFSPRVGFAWIPLRQTSVRGGFGIFNDTTGLEPAIATGFSQTTEMQPTTDNYLTPSATLTNPFPAGIAQPTGSSLGLATYLGQAVSFYPKRLPNDYAVRWSLSMERDLPGDTLFEIRYLGAHLVHLGVTRSLSFVPASYLNVGQVRDDSVISLLSASVANPFAGLLPGTSLNTDRLERVQLLLPYPQFTSVTMTDDPIGGSLYNSLAVRVERRLSRGIRFMGNYTLSKKLDRLDFLNPQDTTLERRISEDDRPHRLVGSATYELPFGRNRLLNPGIPAVSYLASGWDLTGIYTFQPLGPPLAWGDVIYNGSSLNDLKVDPHRVNGAFDTTRFDTASADQPVSGDHIRTLPTQVTHARADGINSMDLSIIKANRITDKLRAQLRADFFNALNHPNFSAPSLSATSSGFGKITSQANLPRQTQIEIKFIF